MIELLLDLLGGAFPSHKLCAAGGAIQALALCRSDLPWLAVVDIALPETSGIDVARQIKALSPEVGVVMHSSYDHAIYREQSLIAGADAFVSKARTYAELVPTMARLLARHPQCH
jgi:DNA-binding NarL/FixJ family response regulator